MVFIFRLRPIPSISNLCFAYDTIIFYRDVKSEALALKSILDVYAKASGCDQLREILYDL